MEYIKFYYKCRNCEKIVVKEVENKYNWDNPKLLKLARKGTFHSCIEDGFMDSDQKNKEDIIYGIGDCIKIKMFYM
jgi:hypothetical protein